MRLRMMLGVPAAFLAAAALVVATGGGAGAVAGPDVEAGPLAIDALVSVSCINTSRCWAAGEAGSDGGVIIASSNGGASWDTQLQDAKTSFSSITCASATYCWAIGHKSGSTPTIFDTVDGGSNWHAETIPSGVDFLGNISCTDTSDCWAAGSRQKRGASLEAVLNTTTSGRSWTEQTTPKISDGMGDNAAITCNSASNCVYAGFGALTTTNGGTTWKLRKVPDGTLPFVAVSCASKDCVALGYAESAIPKNEAADIVTSTNGGKTWTITVEKVAAVTELSGVSCEGTKLCVAIGQHYTETHGSYSFAGAIFTRAAVGDRWKPRTPPAGVGGLFDVTCPSSTHCVAVGALKADNAGTVLTSTNAGKSWTVREP